jgi:signal transduction histidine kinase
MNDAMGHHPEGHGAGEGGAGLPTSGGSPGRSPRDRRGGPTDAADRLSALTHELRNLLDGSLRWLSITSRGLPEPSDHPGDELLGEEIERTRKRLETVRLALVQMNNLVAGSMKAGLSLGSPAFAAAERVSLAEALDHAADVVRPRAASLGIDITVDLDDRAGPRAAGPMYTVMLNGLHNAIDSVERRLGKTGDGARGGKVLARLAWSERGGLSRAALFIEDDGEGPPDLDDPGAVFDPGYSSKGAAAASGWR